MSTLNFNAGTASAALEVWTLSDQNNVLVFDINYETIADQFIPGQTITIPSNIVINHGQATSQAEITLSNLSGPYAWYIFSKPSLSLGTASSCVIKGSDFTSFDIGPHVLTLEIFVGTVPYGLQIPFRVQ